ncbi:hypothetical protein LTR37_018044 [Vermiconidia calcicola]|uniref:Uncharacterized protein n=1 Tax=Vermiconidia calcicola TaxID=1690605 RepID=A0ACC3MI41_9PEZI|nr:hypothetical protein LTR37_018044 [Vermiconidia calcicola]
MGRATQFGTSAILNLYSRDMSYQRDGYGSGQYAGYNGYGQQAQTPQMHQANQGQYRSYQHPQVVIPIQQPVSNPNQTSPLLYQRPPHPPQIGYYQQSPVQYQQTPQGQFYAAQSPQQQSQSLHYQRQAQHQPYNPRPLPNPEVHQPWQSPNVQHRHPQQRQQQAGAAQAPTPQQQQQQQRHQPVQPPMSTAPVRHQPQQRVVAHVEIPVQRPAPKPADHEMARSPKRRRSNEGHAVPVCEVPNPPKPSSQRLKQEPPASSPLTELNSSQFPPTPQPNVDYQAVLLALSDEYVTAAYSLSTSIATGNATDKEGEEYYSLISTAMGCLESVLANFRHSDPRKEARIRLRLASLLVEETENDEQAEEVLSKGITLCDRSRLSDLKYAMQHLLIRSLFKRTPKASLKAADRMAQECEALRLGHWVYAFHFLQVSLSLERGDRADHAAILKHLAALNALSEEQRDIAVQLVAATLEAIVHLRSGSLDAVDLTQRAMAIAHTHQLGPEMQKMPQIRALLDCLDVTCSLAQFDPDQAGRKMQHMQQNMDTGTRDRGWSKDGSFAVELGDCVNEELEQDTCGILHRSKDGQALLPIQWINNGQVYGLGFLLSGIATMCKNNSESKAEQFLDGGWKMARVAPVAIPQSLAAVVGQLERQERLGVAMRLYMTLSDCARFEFEAAQQKVEALKKEFATAGAETDESNARMLMYLEGLCKQGLGELQAALDLYNSPNLTFEPDSKASNFEKDIRALATLNSIFILRTLGTSEFAKAEHLLARVANYTLVHPNKAIGAILNIIRATAPHTQTANPTMIKTKQHIQSAVQAARDASNNQLVYIVMNIMTDMFFRNTIVGNQAESSANAGRTLARKGRNGLWTCVADGMFGDIMERCGKVAAAEEARAEGEELFPGLVEPLRRSLE